MPTMPDTRLIFRSERADILAKAVNSHLTRRPLSRGWTTRCVWYDGDEELMAVVGSHEAEYTDLALAHGLLHCGDRRLILVLPNGWSSPTLHRLPWLTPEIHVYEYDDVTLQPRRAPAQSKVKVAQNAGGSEKTPALHLDHAASDWLRELAEWANRQPELDPAHLRNTRVWSCLGQRVLTITGQRNPVVTAGINAKAQAASRLKITGPINPAAFAEICDAVAGGIRDASDQKYGPFAEHRLQQVLRAAPFRVSLEHPVLREVPAWRPTGGAKPLGRGFIDLVGLDPMGDLVIVETKLAADDMLVLQGLDYWIWAQKRENRDWLVERLHADPARAKTRLLYAVGGKGGAKPVLSRYCKAHLNALDDTVEWRLALLSAWDTDNMTVDLLPQRTSP